MGLQIPVRRLRQTHPQRGAWKRGICLGLDLGFGRQPPVRNGLESRSILAYDATLNYKSSFRYGFPALDFIKVKDGFLFLNLLATDNLHRVVHTNDRGEVQQSYLPSEMSLDMIYNETSFVRDKNGEAYIFPPFSNAIYRWTSEGPKPVFRTDFGKNAAGEDVKSSYDITESGKAFNTGFFIVDNHLVNRFFHAGKKLLLAL
mgnify:CR=1 FL=1